MLIKSTYIFSLVKFIVNEINLFVNFNCSELFEKYYKKLLFKKDIIKYTDRKIRQGEKQQTDRQTDRQTG